MMQTIRKVIRKGGKRREEDAHRETDVYLYEWLRNAALFMVRLPG